MTTAKEVLADARKQVGENYNADTTTHKEWLEAQVILRALACLQVLEEVGAKELARIAGGMDCQYCGANGEFNWTETDEDGNSWPIIAKCSCAESAASNLLKNLSVLLNEGKEMKP